MERVVVALGGNALLRRGQDDTFENLYRLGPLGGRGHRRHRDGRLGGRRHARQRPAGRPDPPAAGGREAVGAPDAARRLRRREPGADRLPAPGHDRRRLLRARDGAAGRDRPHAHARATRRPGVREPVQADRALLRGGRGAAARDRAGLGAQARPARRVPPRRALAGSVLHRRGARDPNPGRRRHDRDRLGRRWHPGGRGRPQADRPRGRGRQGPGRRDPRARRRGLDPVDPHRRARPCSAGSGPSAPRRSSG